jgi:hypothetical protein
LTRNTRNLLRSALGLRYAKLPYRNGLRVPPGHHLLSAAIRAVDLGLLQYAEPDRFFVTEAGFKALYPKRWAEMKARAES